MNIPSALQKFEKPTVIVVCGETEAKLFLAHGEEIHFLEDVSVDTSSDPSGAPVDHSDDMHWNESNAKHFFVKIDKALAPRLQNGEWEEAIVCVPDNYVHALPEQFSEAIKEHLRLVVPKQLLKMNEEQILEAVVSAM